MSAAIGSARLSDLGESGRQIRLMLMLKRDGEGNYSTEVSDSTLPRKAAIEDIGARTANRHR